MLLKSSVTFSIAIYASAAVVAAVACIFLPIETAGRELTDNIQQQSKTKVTSL